MNGKVSIDVSFKIDKETEKKLWELEVYDDYDRIYYREFKNGDAFVKKVDYIKEVIKSYEEGECTLEDLLDIF